MSGAFSYVQLREMTHVTFKIIRENKKINIEFFTSTKLEPYSTPLSMEEFHQALTPTNETRAGYEQIIFQMFENIYKTLLNRDS